MSENEGKFKKEVNDLRGYWIDQISKNQSDVMEFTINAFLKIVEDAKQDLYSKIHDSCWFSTEAGCHAPSWEIYHKQPEDCPLRRLEKWFGTIQTEEKK